MKVDKKYLSLKRERPSHIKSELARAARWAGGHVQKSEKDYNRQKFKKEERNDG